MTNYNIPNQTNVSFHLDDSISDIFSDPNEPKNKNSGRKKIQVWDFFEAEGDKEQRCNRALTRFFICCGISFKIVMNPFFIDLVKCLCPSYQLSNRITFAGSWVNQELAQVISMTSDVIRGSDNITLGTKFF